MLRPKPKVIGVRDPDVAATLATEGFARLGQVLNADECTHLSDTFDEVARRLDRPLGTDWFPTILLPDPDVRALIDKELRKVVSPALEQHLDSSALDTVRIDYSVKPPGPSSHLGPHQDYSIVDERQWTSLYVWIPLTDTDEQNGTLHVLPRSHRYTNAVRSRHVPAMFDPVLTAVEEASTPLVCKAGELIVMVSGVVHHSPPNLSTHLRLAAHGIYKPRQAPLVFYFADEQTPDDQVEMYEVSINQYIELALGDRPGPGVERTGTCSRDPIEMQPARFELGRSAAEGRPLQPGR